MSRIEIDAGGRKVVIDHDGELEPLRAAALSLWQATDGPQPPPGPSDLGIPVKTAMDEMVAGMVAVAESGGDDVGLDRVREVQSRLRRRSITDDLLREAAEVYRAAERAGAPSVVRAVAERFTISYSSAERWVRQARARGFLPPAGRRAR